MPYWLLLSPDHHLTNQSRYSISNNKRSDTTQKERMLVDKINYHSFAACRLRYLTVFNNSFGLEGLTARSPQAEA